MLSIIFAILAGISVTLQTSFNGIMTPYLGAMGTSFIGFVVQVIVLNAMQFIKERRPAQIKDVPFKYYIGGLIAALVVGITGFCVSRLGSAITICCTIAGQMIMSTIIDHFGLFGSEKKPFTTKRIPAFVMIIIGVIVINLIGNAENGDVPLPLLLLAMLMGAGSVIVRTINYKMTQITGSGIAAGIVNSIAGTVVAFIIFMFTIKFKPDFMVFTQIPFVCYLAGVCGSSSILCNIVAYRQGVFYATIFMLIGQVGVGILMDVFVFHTLSAGKCVGIMIILAGVIIDKLISRTKEKT